MQKLLGKLEAVDPRTYWLDEARDFTPWLAKEESLELLSASIGMDLELEGVEVAVGPFKADILARDASSNVRVVIENQLERTNHDHLGKALTYASGLDARAVVWIAREFAEEHRRAVDFLNELAAPNLRVFGVQIQLWRIGESPAAPLFEVVAKPNDYREIVSPPGTELTETKALYLEFWDGFRQFCTSRGTFLGFRKPRPQHWYSLSIGRSRFGLNLTASIQKRRLGCEIYASGGNAKRAFRELLKQRDEIEQQTGALEWMELPEGQDCRIVRYQPEIDVSDRTTWDTAYTWFKAEAETFHKVFAARIKALPLIDEPETAASIGLDAMTSEDQWLEEQPPAP